MRHDRIAAALVAAAALALLAGCGTGTNSATPSKHAASGSPNRTASPTAARTTSLVEQLRDAPEVLVLGGQEYVMTASLWRDNTTPAALAGRPLTATIELIERNGNPIPADLKLDYLWAVNGGGEVWATAFANEPQPSLLPNHMVGVARMGPQWEPGTTVDVVVALRQGGGPQLLLRVEDQTIRTPNV